MSPQGFVEFRSYLKPASGFQSFQFRLIENKLGVRKENRVNYGKCNYLKVFKDKNTINSIKNSENEPSLHDLIERWLEKLSTDKFIETYSKSVNRMFKYSDAEINRETDAEVKKQLKEDFEKKKQLFDQLNNEKRYNELVARGDRRFSFKAFKSALCISVNKEKYGLMNLVINQLQEIDLLLHGWRGN